VAARVSDATSQFGESFIGQGAEAAHINTVLGAKGGPVEAAFATALATPRPGHVAFVTVVRPGLAVKPLTLFVNKAPLNEGHEGRRHAELTWGAAQAGLASGVLWAVADSVVPPEQVNERLLIAAVWVDPAARNEALVYENNRQAARAALEAGRDGLPALDEVLSVRDAPRNPFLGLRLDLGG
jgi:5,6,7,8-tetrahydromethanopterin hydro-lyase